MSNFIPDHKQLDAGSEDVPYFEDSAKNEIAGRGTKKSVATLQKEVAAFLVKLNGYGVRFVMGRYPSPKGTRYGYQITFAVNGNPARIECAALPLRKETVTSADRALAQALYLLRNKLEAEYFAWVYAPGSIPLLPYLVGRDNKTLTESIIESGAINLLPANVR